MHDYDIWLSNIGPPFPDIINDNYKLCYHRSGITPGGATDTITCQAQFQYRYVYYSINSTTATERLSMCEMEGYPHGNFVC